MMELYIYKVLPYGECRAREALNFIMDRMITGNSHRFSIVRSMVLRTGMQTFYIKVDRVYKYRVGIHWTEKASNPTIHDIISLLLKEEEGAE